MYPTVAPMPNPLSRAQFESIRLLTPPAPEYAANAPIRNQSAPAGIKLNSPVLRSNPKYPTSAASHTRGAKNSRQRKVIPPSMATTRTQFSISSVRSIRRPNSRITTQPRNAPTPSQYTALASVPPGSFL